MDIKIKVKIKELFGWLQSKRFNVIAENGVYIGRHCVIGANSVVTKDVPDYSVAVGSPAKVIKRI